MKSENLERSCSQTLMSALGTFVCNFMNIVSGEISPREHFVSINSFDSFQII